MTSTQPQQMTASSARRLYWALVGGLLAIMAVFGLLFWLGTAPLLASNPESIPVIAPAMALFALGSLAFGWFWARPNVPLRPQDQSPSTFWEDSSAGAKALLLWVLWEGGTITATIGSVLTGSVLTESVAAIGLALLVTHSPAYLENRGG
jgi:hypothetical protein